MTKKHFIELADFLKAVKPVPVNSPDEYSRGYNDGRLGQWEVTRDMMAEYLERNNMKFKKQLWLDYVAGIVGPSGGKIK